MRTVAGRPQNARRFKRLMARAVTAVGRECGGCTACCTVMAVTELAKGMYQPCRHVGAAGCAIYDDRPRSCRAWHCQWQLGEVGGARPDQSGVVINLGFRGGPHYEVYELWPGAATEPDVVMNLARLALPVFIFPHSSAGQVGDQRRGPATLTNCCPFGHGVPTQRISLPVLPDSAPPEMPGVAG